jgi:hypothetical protein
MGIVIAIIAICAIAISTTVFEPDVPVDNREDLSASTTASPVPSITPAAVSETIVSRPEITPLPTESSVTSSGFIYPNAQVLENTGSRLRMTTTDPTDKVTEWYQSSFRNQGMKTTSFVKTKTNGNVVNKLAGASSGLQATVEITQSNNQPVNIVVTY